MIYLVLGVLLVTIVFLIRQLLLEICRLVEKGVKQATGEVSS